MARDGHVKVERGGRISLTALGRKVAQHLMLRHQLAEMLLTEVIGLSGQKPMPKPNAWSTPSPLKWKRCS